MPSTKKKTTKAKTAKKPVKQPEKKKQVKTEKPIPSKRTLNQVLPFVFGFLSVFFAVCLISPGVCGAFGNWLNAALFGVLGASAVIFPILIMLLAIFWLKLIDDNKIYFRTAYGLVAQYTLAVFLHVVIAGTEKVSAGELYNSGINGGGVIGGSSAILFSKGIGSIFTAILSILLFSVFTLLLFNVTPARVFNACADAARRSAQNKKPAKPKAVKLPKPEKHVEPEAEEEPDDPPMFGKNNSAPVAGEAAIRPSAKKKAYDFDSDKDAAPKPSELNALLNDDEPDADNDALPISAAETEDYEELSLDDDKPAADEPEAENAPAASIDDDDDEILPVVRTPVGVKPQDAAQSADAQPTKEPEEPAEPEQPTYTFPPIDLLALDRRMDTGEADAEMKESAKKLLDVLNSFNVKATVEDINRGPTVTRYELKPAPGVRISSIQRLMDDIALSFATTSVRFEPSIQGKGAVGIEVPNKTVSTVRIRSLIDTEAFAKAESKITCALGVTVTGEPVYFDIAKMPHLLIAGATGMGKSVCINSIIISILYKASPEDVKLMLVDPKKVEFIPYSGIPHLLVPVVTDPKKAAGALNWLVNEMERRYSLIEAVGCRNIFGYNTATANDPEKEHLPQIVIIIDELADLMMTAKENVEESICRLAAKARAAGMHLIMGTQRPDVSVITGTIKANIPSRIACKTASQIDSRTIIDEAGAEKLIGRGDMLFAPVGAMKKVRIQGAFVSDKEVETVAAFIKNNSGTATFNKNIIAEIDEESKNIGTAGKKLSIKDSEEDGDELLVPAIEYCFDSGKVATSMLQRRLSIGYGRAAKLIDRMEEMGICSAPDGTKARTLKMTKEEFVRRYADSDAEPATDASAAADDEDE